MSEIVRLISETLQLPENKVEKSINLAPYRVRKYYINKKSGGKREILQPSAQIKPVIYWLQAVIFDKLPVHGIATGFREGVSILDNASMHKDSLYSVRIDISDFFPSIRPNDIFKIISTHKEILPAWAVTADAFDVILKSCFDRDQKLPIGYASSPSIANAVMYSIDALLKKSILQKDIFGDAVLTRYADDFVFSTNMVGACKAFFHLLQETFTKSTSPKLSINVAKTRYMSRMGGSTLITGLRVNNNGDVVVHPKYRDHVRLLLKLYHEVRLSSEEIPKLIGHLAHVQHVDPAFFTRLSVKYFRDIQHLRTSKPILIS